MFRMGSDDPQAFSNDGEGPVRLVCLDKFYIPMERLVEPGYAQNILLYEAAEHLQSSPSLQSYTPVTDPALLLPWIHSGI